VTWAVRFTALAEDDVAAAYAWYAVSRDGLGDEFLGDVNTVVRTLSEFPEAGPLTHRELRRMLLLRFPYTVYYRVLPTTTTIEIRGCVHQRRHPRTWHRRA